MGGLDVHPLQVLDDGGEVDDDAGVENLRVAAEEVGEGGAAHADLAEVVEDGDHVLLDATAEDEGVGVDVGDGEAEGAEEVDALAHDVDGGGELEAVELVGDDAEGAEEVVHLGAGGGAGGLHLGEAGPGVEGGRPRGVALGVFRFAPRRRRVAGRSRWCRRGGGDCSAV